MNKGWRIVLVIVVVCIAVGAVSAGVGILTGADIDRIGSVIQERAAEKYNIDASAVIHEWIPQSAATVRDAVLGRK